MIRKAVIPAAGYGTRFLPATKSVPKEMLPVVDRPVIQYVVEEAVASGLEDILIVLSRALLLAHDHVGDEPFAVLLGDTLMDAAVPVTRQLMDIQARFGNSLVALEQVPPAKVARYGVAATQAVGERLYRIDDLVEKPVPERAPSNRVIAGRYLLEPVIFDILERAEPGRNGELQLTDALAVLARQERLLGLEFEGHRHDLGNKLDWLEANMVFGLARPDIGAELRGFLDNLLRRNSPV